jgi:hypothetical protein
VGVLHAPGLHLVRRVAEGGHAAASTLNDRGKWLMAEKDQGKAKEVDGTWLEDYVEEKKK